jgi:hypothetical protein
MNFSPYDVPYPGLAEKVAVPPLSQSRYERMSCSASYVWNEVYGYQQMDSEWSALGNEVDALLYNWALHNQREKSQVTDQIHLESILKTASPEAQEIVRHFLDNFSLDWKNIVGLQKHLLGGDDLEGTLDVLLKEGKGFYRVLDFKNHFRVFNPDSFQSKLYPLLVFLNYPDAEQVDFTLAFTRYGCVRSLPQPFSRRDVPQLMELAEAARTRQLAMHESPQAYESQALAGSWCVYCPLLRMRECPLEGRNPAEMSKEDRLQWQVYLKHAVRENDLMLKELATRGEIKAKDSHGRQIQGGFVLKETKQYPAGPALVLLNEWKNTTDGQDDLIADLHFSRSALASKLKAKKRAVLDQAMDDIAVTEQRTEFEISEE